MTNFRKVLTTILAVVIVGIKTELILAEGTAGASAASVAQANASGANPGGIAAPGSADSLQFTGSYSYSYPIVLPPGLAGMEPLLKAEYNSSSNYGWLGVGWNLSLGTIQRSTKNGVPKYDASDTFVVTLAGETLELVKIPDNTYRSKIEGSFQKFELGTNGWVVTDKRGTKYFFGQTDQTRIKPTGFDTYLWALDRVQDRNGNYFTASYFKPANENQIYLQQIDYTGTSARPAKKKVVFICETSPWVDRNYSPGFLSLTTQRLKAIETYASNSLVWKYDFVYAVSQNSFRVILQQIVRTGLDGVSKFPATAFEYQGSNQPLSFASALGLPVSDWTQLEEHIEAGDWNGDGKMDIMFHRNGTPGYGSGVYISNGDGTFQGKGPIPGSDWTTKNNFVTTGDFNGDGKTDIVVYRNADPGYGGVVQLSRGDGTFRATTACPGANFAKPNTYVISADFNGDGFSDLGVYTLQDPGGPVPGIFFSNGDGTFRRGGNIPGSDWTQTGEVVLTGDFNGDGKADLALYRDGTPGKGSSVWFSNGDGTFTQKGQIPGSAWDGTNDRVIAVDINRDNLTDFVVWREKAPTSGVSTGQFGPTVYLSQGNGSFTFYGSYFMGLSSQGSQMLAGDFNGDGYTDLGAFRAADPGYQGKILLNKGDGTFYSGFNLPGSDWTTAHNYVVPGDFSGDGKADLIVFRSADPGHGAGVYLSQGVIPDLLSRITNGLGGETRITYKSSTQSSNRLLPFPVTVVDRITQLDGRCNPTANECITSQNFYQGGFYDIRLREFLGFAQVDGVDAQGNKTTVKYHQERDIFGSTVPQNGFKGRVYMTQTNDSNNNPLTSHEVQWEYKPLYSNVIFVRPRWIRDSLRDVSPPKQTQVDYYYDDAPSTGTSYGNVISTIRQGDIQIAGDETIETIEYAKNESAYIVSLPRRILLTDSQNHTLSEEKFFYDGYSEVGKVDYGNPTEIWKWLDKPTPRWLISKSQYDSGRVIAATDPKGNKSTIGYDEEGFASVITNSRGDSLSSTHDPKTGNILTETDINGGITTHRYDAFGREVKLIGPLDSEAFPTLEYDYHLNLLGNPSQQHVETRVREQYGTPGYIWSKNYFDGAGRTYRTEQEDVAGKIRVAETIFNNRGLAERTSTPRFSTDANILWTVSKYDTLGRVTRVEHPDPTKVPEEFTYLGRKKTVTDSKNNTQSSETDAFGRVIYRYEAGNSIPTTYAYDLLGNLTATTDSKGKTTTYRYDSLGRKLSITDPNTGTWSYEYDDSGNLLRQTDARGVKIEFSYDALNRLTSKKLLADAAKVTGQTVNQPFATFSYDEPDHPNSKGRLTTVQDASGITRFYHDSVGRIIREQKEPTPANYYDVTTSYDAMDRVTLLTYPSLRSVKFTYDEAGRLSTISNGNTATIYASYPSYNALGQPLELRQADNNTRTLYTYNNLTALISSMKIETGINGTPKTIMQNSYSYDPVGNVTQITDGVNSNRSQTFGYDNLYRLTSATGMYGRQLYTYDVVGNFLTKGPVSYKYDDPLHPSAVTQTIMAIPPALDPTTLLSWNLDSSENIHSFSGVVRSSATNTPLNGVAVIMTGPIEIGVKTGISGSSATTPGGFLFRNLTGGGSSYALSLSSAGMNPSPLQYAYTDLNQDRTAQDFILAASTDPALNLTKLRVPRTALLSGTPSESASSDTYKVGVLFGAPYGGTASTSTTNVYTAVSGYSPKADAADTRTQSVSPTLQPPPANLTGVIGPLFVAGRYKQGLSFNGSGDVFLFPNTETISPTTLTLMMWVKPSGYPTGVNYATIIDKSTGAAIGRITNGYRIVLSSAGTVVFDIGQQTGSASLRGTKNIPLNKWSFIAATFDGTALKIFVNGVLDAQIISASQLMPNISNVHLGAVINSDRRLVGGSYFKGVLDEPRIQGRAWSADEITAAYVAVNGNATFAYDANGNMIKKTTEESVLTYAYDAEGRLRQASIKPTASGSTTTVVSYVYNSNGSRVKKITPQGITLFIGKLFELRPDGTGVDHVYAGGTQICDITGPVAGATPTPIPPTTPVPMPTPIPGATPIPSAPTNVLITYYHQNHLGSVSMATDSNGVVLQDIAYEPFGTTVFSSGTSLTNRKYTGQEEDPETGLYYYNARYYDAMLGRFISPDSIVQNRFDPQALNRYAYVRNNPVVLTDPSGHKFSWKKIWDGIVNIIVGNPPRSDPNPSTPSSPPSTTIPNPGGTNPTNSPQDALSTVQTLSLLHGGLIAVVAQIASAEVMESHDGQKVFNQISNVLENHLGVGRDVARFFAATVIDTTVQGVTRTVADAIGGVRYVDPNSLTPEQRAKYEEIVDGSGAMDAGGRNVLSMRGKTGPFGFMNQELAITKAGDVVGAVAYGPFGGWIPFLTHTTIATSSPGNFGPTSYFFNGGTCHQGVCRAAEAAGYSVSPGAFSFNPTTYMSMGLFGNDSTITDTGSTLLSLSSWIYRYDQSQ